MFDRQMTSVASRYRRYVCCLLLSGLVPGWVAPTSASTMTITAADNAAFRTYLAEHGLADRWQGEPARVDTPEIRAAFRGMRFYYTFKNPPLPPGAHTAELIAAYDRAMDEYRHQSLRITVGIDQQGRVHAFRAAEDFNHGLLAVKTDDDARTAAAAILSLMGTQEASPGAISANEINVTNSATGWTCRLSQQRRGIQGSVNFDRAGRCVSAAKSLNYSRPLPP